jgi:glucose/arabinose dehydrogenase
LNGRRGLAAVLALVSTGLVVSPSGAQPERKSLRLVRVVAGLSNPLHATAPKNEKNRLYVVEQVGRIRVIVNGRLRAEPFLDIRNIVRSGGEQGLLSVAFHPNYARNHRFYVDYTDRNGDTRVVEYRSNGSRARLGTRRQLLFVDQPYPNHNGGQLAFGPDGYLYVGMGDGGSGGDPENRAQNLRSLLGKLLKVNVNRRGAGWQIVGYGLRNPWRFSFDRKTGDLYIGDVGQGAWEEIDYTRRRSRGLENYGWDVFEGNARYENKPLNSAGHYVAPIVTLPISDYTAITGGFVYRGSQMPSARGRYFYGEFGTGRIWSLKVVGGKATDERLEPLHVDSLASFGEDASGELYAVSLGGTVYRLAG